jgi:site-specific recombinase XerD
LESKNRSAATARAYRADIRQFVTWLQATNVMAYRVDQVERADLTEYLAHLGQQGLSGVSRARKLAALREYFRFLAEHDHIPKSPVTGVDTPKREKHGKTFLRPEEYTRMLAQAGANPRDYAILQIFLQTGVRISELCALRVEDIDLDGHLLHVRSGKGMQDRAIELEKRGILAVKSWLRVRPEVPNDHLFLSRYGEPLGERGVRKLVAKFRQRAGITKRATPHSLRHTFATYKAEKGVSPFQLQEWLGHASLNTTQIYVHLGRQNSRKVMEATSL